MSARPAAGQIANVTAAASRVLGRVLHLSLLQYAWQDVKSEQALSPDGIVAAFTSCSIFPLTAEVGNMYM